MYSQNNAIYDEVLCTHDCSDYSHMNIYVNIPTVFGPRDWLSEDWTTKNACIRMLFNVVSSIRSL